MDLSGATLGQYEIINQLGLGGMATVYKARQPSLDRYVAIKVLKADLAKSSGFVARFEREARAIARLRHRNILTVFDYGHENDLFYLVMEYVAAGTLKERLGWPLDLGYAISTVAQIGDALAHAHRLGMIHRDVKPGNVLMVEEDWPLLSDFGLAKIVEDSLHLTMSGASVGTPQYMSPEQAQCLPVDRRSDIYSLGVVLYEAVTGQPPFGFDSPMAVILKHINDPVTPPHQLRSDLPGEIERVIIKSLAKDPDHRYQRMEDFVGELHEAGRHSQRQGKRFDFKDMSSIFEPPSTSKATSSQPTRRKPTWTKTVIRLLVLTAVLLTLLLYRNSLAPLASMLSQAIAVASADLLTTPSPLPATVGPTPSAVEASASEGTPTPTATAPLQTPTAAPVVVAATPTLANSTPTPLPSATPTLDPTPTVPSLPPIQIRHWEADGADMVFVPAGEFTMGSNELGDDERPVHQVYLTDFWLDRYEVTNTQFARFVAETGYQTDAERAGWGWVRLNDGWEQVNGANWQHPRGPITTVDGKQNHPVVLVSWNDADAYCRWAGKRLPTEAQWEKAARGTPPYIPPASGGERGGVYPWGDEFDRDRANTKEAGLNDTTPVGNFSPLGDSPYGAADMTGNAWEWVADWYAAGYYSQSPDTNPTGPITGAYKVLRGGSWLYEEVYGRTAFRHNLKPDYTYDFTGFRCSSQ